MKKGWRSKIFKLKKKLKIGSRWSKSHDFYFSGPSHLTTVDWTNEHYKRSAVASLVKGVSIVGRYSQKKREGSQALASPWWEFFNFQMLEQLEDDVDSSIIGAIYKFIPPASHSNLSTDGCPCYVIAFRGTLLTRKTWKRDVKTDLKIIFNNTLHSDPRFKKAMEAVRIMVDSVGSSNVWLAGHSLGSAMALVAGKTMAKTGIFLESFLFNPPFPSVMIEGIKFKKAKLVIRLVSSTATSSIALAMMKKPGQPFLYLSEWVPRLFVNPDDPICSGYVGFFKHKKRMVELGVGCIERLATHHSLRGLIKSMWKESEDSEPWHRIPSANLTVNLNPSDRISICNWKKPHRINQWWRSPEAEDDPNLESILYQYN